MTDFYVRGSNIGILGNSRTSSLRIGTCSTVDVATVGQSGGTPITCTGPADTAHRYVVLSFVRHFLPVLTIP